VVVRIARKADDAGKGRDAVAVGIADQAAMLDEVRFGVGRPIIAAPLDRCLNVFANQVQVEIVEVRSRNG
jgi:hypothetical protein